MWLQNCALCLFDFTSHMSHINWKWSHWNDRLSASKERDNEMIFGWLNDSNGNMDRM